MGRKRIINCNNYLEKKLYCDRNEHPQCRVCNECYREQSDRRCNICEHRCPTCTANCSKCHLACDNRRTPYKV